MLNLEHLNNKKYPTTFVIESNMLVLYQRLKFVEAKWVEHQKKTRPEKAPTGFKVTSGLRSEKHQAELVKAGKSTALKSKHLLGCAADIEDPPEGDLECGPIKLWLRENPEILIVADIWCEHWDYTLNWWHAQIVPPGSGRRWFLP